MGKYFVKEAGITTNVRGTLIGAGLGGAVGAFSIDNDDSDLGIARKLIAGSAIGATAGYGSGRLIEKSREAKINASKLTKDKIKKFMELFSDEA